MNHAVAPALETQHDAPVHANGVAKLSKFSPFVVVLISMTTAGIGSYYAARQDTLVVEAKLDLEIQQNKADIAEMKVLLNQVLHDVVATPGARCRGRQRAGNRTVEREAGRRAAAME